MRMCGLRAFRDVLRADHGLGDQYEALKRNLANMFRNDREVYTKSQDALHRKQVASERGSRRNVGWDRNEPRFGKGELRRTLRDG